MATKDHAYRNNHFVQSIAPGAKTATATGTGVDTSTFESVAVIIDSGAWTDGSHTPKLQDSADNSTFADVTAANLDGTFTAITSSGTASQVYKVGYKGAQRYVRAVVTVSGATTGAVYGAAIVLSDPHVVPAS